MRWCVKLYGRFTEAIGSTPRQSAQYMVVNDIATFIGQLQQYASHFNENTSQLSERPVVPERNMPSVKVVRNSGDKCHGILKIVIQL